MDEFCPECNAPLDIDEVDIGVGVQRGNYRCPDCGWDPRADPRVEEWERVAEREADAMCAAFDAHPDKEDL